MTLLWQIMAKHKVRSFFTGPTAIRAIKQVDPSGKLAKEADFSDLKAFSLAGERPDPDTLHWTEKPPDVPVIDHWWQTETGSAITANPLGIKKLPVKAGSSTVPMPGWQIECLDSEVEPGETGAIATKLPLPTGFAPTLWNAPERYAQAYLECYQGYYLTGDAGYFDADGYLHIMARIDDVINVAGHRLSSSAIEAVLASHPAVAECAVIGMADELKGQLSVGFAVLKAGAATGQEELKAELISGVRENIGPVVAFKRVHFVDKLPKTRSGKILRKTMREITDGKDVVVLSTMEDRAVLDDYQESFA